MSFKPVMFFLHHKLFNDKLNLFYYYYFNIIFSCKIYCTYYNASCNACCMKPGIEAKQQKHHDALIIIMHVSVAVGGAGIGWDGCRRLLWRMCGDGWGEKNPISICCSFSHLTTKSGKYGKQTIWMLSSALVKHNLEAGAAVLCPHCRCLLFTNQKRREKRRLVIFIFFWRFTAEELCTNVNSVLTFIPLSEAALSGEPEHLHFLSMTINLILKVSADDSSPMWTWLLCATGQHDARTNTPTESLLFIWPSFVKQRGSLFT